MRGMRPRILPENGPAPMQPGDVSSWISHIAAIIFFAAIVPWKIKFSCSLICGLIVVYINWLIGSRWAIALSELTVSKEYSYVLSRGKRKTSIEIEIIGINKDFQSYVEYLQIIPAEALVCELERAKNIDANDKKAISRLISQAE
jgi:hypothetical protein